jgi:hypothetical protein
MKFKAMIGYKFPEMLELGLALTYHGQERIAIEY